VGAPVALCRLVFGYHPQPLDLQVGLVTVTPLADLAEVVGQMDASEGVERGWIYAPLQDVRGFSGEVRTQPYTSRVFGLPKTHLLVHKAADSDEHVAFHLWALSFFCGLRLTATEAGFLDATPLKPGMLVDFVTLGDSLAKSVELTEAFWNTNRSEPRRARLLAAAVHALFLGQNPRNLQFENFVFLYTALDACYALAASLRPPPKALKHADRVAWMCNLFGITIPFWADPNASGGSEVATIRNATIHEALFMGEPLGFALHGIGTSQNLPLEMKALICRLLVALSGGDNAEYVRSPIHTRHRHGLDLG